MPTQPIEMLSPKSFRKALFEERGISTAEIASEVGCSVDTVRRVVDGEIVYETGNSKNIKRLYASRVGLPVTDLWPEPDDQTGPTGSATQEPGEVE